MPSKLFSKLLFKQRRRRIPDGSSPTSEDSSSNSFSGSPAPLPAGDYEVFLNFRGPDNRNSFADFLYHYLSRSKIRTFRDNEDLRKGEEIWPALATALAQSKIYIPILSRNYASSKWCLRELAKMVECCKENKGHVVLPIFYFVDPRDVRHQTGPYHKAFRLHQSNYKHETVQEWKDALEQVGAMKGWHVTDLEGQGAVIDDVFQNVLSLLSKNYTLVTDELVGVDHHVEEVVKLLNLGSGGVTTVGIHGMGGIGKTTIATAVYNKVCTLFDRCSFVDDVTETLRWSNGIVTLQNKLIYGITKDGSPIGSASEGIHKIKDRVCQYKVLVVLDDVNDEFNFKKILGWSENFFPGSRFIITTRNKKVLSSMKSCKLYEPKEMSFDFSLQLFSKYAFKTNSPPKDYESLSRGIVTTTAGLPLALKVVGSLLFEEDKSVWEEKLMQLKEVPSMEVVEKLKISYNALTYEEQQIFLDIACFFIGKDKEIASYMWRDCNFYPVSAVNVLLARSLIKIGKDHKFQMHDQLRDLGRAIVREENVENEWKRSRIYDNDWLDLQCCSSEVNQMRGMQVSGYGKCTLTDKYFKNFRQLSYLDASSLARLTGDFNGLLPNLRWLGLRFLAESSGLTNLHLKKLVILDLSGSNITSEEEAWSQLKIITNFYLCAYPQQMSRNLKVLILAGCDRLTKVPDLSAYGNLEVLNLERCSGIEEDLDIGNLKNLKVLKLRFCRIRKLTGCVAMLLKLEEIDASSCTNLEEIPTDIGELPSLKILKLTSQNNCKVSELPISLIELTISSPVPNLLWLGNLEELQFQDCDHELEIPGDIWKLSQLKTLKLWHINITNLLAPGTGVLPSSLKHLYIEHCQQLGNLPDLSNLKYLMELRLLCPKLREIPGLGELKSLVTLNISDGQGLSNLDGLDKLLSLTYITMNGCAIKSLPSLASLKNLQALNISQCPHLVEIQGLSESLQELGIGDCPSLQRIPNLSRLVRLRYLALHHLQSLPNVNGFESLEALEYLEFRGCQSIEVLPSLSQLTKLKHVFLKDNRCLGRIGSLKGLKLEKVEVSGCSSLKSFPDLSGQENLKEVIIDGCLLLFDIQDLETLGESLKVLQVTNCTSIKKLPTLSNLGSLEILRLENCDNLTEVKGLEGLELLKLLDMSGCKSIEKLPNLSNLGSCLETLSLSNCEKLIEVSGIEELRSLEVLDMSGCKSIEKFPNLSNLGSCLETLSLSNCEKLIEVSGIEGLRSLEVLDMSGCKSVEKLPNLSSLRSRRNTLSLGNCFHPNLSSPTPCLHTLSLSNCEKLIEVSGIEELSWLKVLNMNGCMSIQKLPNLSNLRLETLSLNNCEKLIEVSGTEELKRLKVLEMNNCKSIEMLQLSKSCYLETLSLSGCEKLTSILGLENMRYLRKLDISGCKLTHELPMFRYAKVTRDD
ncbi:Disease resistance protein L6 [Linum grandiflorum]